MQGVMCTNLIVRKPVVHVQAELWFASVTSWICEIKLFTKMLYKILFKMSDSICFDFVFIKKKWNGYSPLYVACRNFRLNVPGR